MEATALRVLLRQYPVQKVPTNLLGEQRGKTTASHVMLESTVKNEDFIKCRVNVNQAISVLVMQARVPLTTGLLVTFVLPAASA